MGKTSLRARVVPSSSKSSTTPSNLTPRRRSVDVLTPLVPPVYPSAPKPSPLNRDVIDKGGHYKKFCQYVSTNYGVHVPRKANTFAFNVQRYTDRYHNLLGSNTDIVPRIGVDRYPEELCTTALFKRNARKINVVKKSLDDLPDDEADVNEGSDVEGDAETENEPNAKKARDGEDEPSGRDLNATNDSIEEDDMEDGDDELDVDTDYVSSYFDNGEDFLDSDNEGDDDGPVY